MSQTIIPILATRGKHNFKTPIQAQFRPAVQVDRQTNLRESIA